MNKKQSTEKTGNFWISASHLAGSLSIIYGVLAYLVPLWGYKLRFASVNLPALDWLGSIAVVIFSAVLYGTAYCADKSQ